MQNADEGKLQVFESRSGANQFEIFAAVRVMKSSRRQAAEVSSGLGQCQVQGHRASLNPLPTPRSFQLEQAGWQVPRESSESIVPQVLQATSRDAA